MGARIMSLEQAISLIPDGAAVAVGGNTFHRFPGQAIHEIIRQRKRGLRLIKTAGSYDVDVLCGTKVATEVTAGYIGFEYFGLAPMFRRTIEQSEVHLWEHT